MFQIGGFTLFYTFSYLFWVLPTRKKIEQYSIWGSKKFVKHEQRGVGEEVVKWKKEWESSEDREEEEEQEEQRVHAQTIYYQENLAFCFSHAQSRTTLVFCRSLGFLGFLGFLVPWFSCSLVFLFLGFHPL
jgi:hypothetical protein